MKKAQAVNLEQKLRHRDNYGRAAFVVAHARFQLKRGRQPSSSYLRERNPRKALTLALNDLKQYEAHCGEDISFSAKMTTEVATIAGINVTFDFNGIKITATPGCKFSDLENFYHTESTRRSEEYKKSPEYAESQRKYQEKEEQAKLKLENARKSAPEKMTLRDEETWKKAVEKNSDGYGSGIIRYAELWACLMEGRIANGETVAGCAEETSHTADSEGISGFMYGCAVSILSQVWIHGEELRRWHNLDSQIGNEGEKANESGGILNPAVLCISA